MTGSVLVVSNPGIRERRAFPIDSGGPVRPAAPRNGRLHFAPRGPIGTRLVGFWPTDTLENPNAEIRR
jgi:hypothetical protein